MTGKTSASGVTTLYLVTRLTSMVWTWLFVMSYCNNYCLITLTAQGKDTITYLREKNCYKFPCLRNCKFTWYASRRRQILAFRYQLITQYADWICHYLLVNNASSKLITWTESRCPEHTSSEFSWLPLLTGLMLVLICQMVPLSRTSLKPCIHFSFTLL